MLMTKEVLSEFAELIRENKCNPYSGNLKTGVDLGTANIVIAVTDEDNHPVAGATAVSKVVKDGIVVDFVGAMQTVRRLKAQLEELLGVTLDTAATAVPPGIMDGNVKCISNVVEVPKMTMSTTDVQVKKISARKRSTREREPGGQRPS